MYWPGAKRSLRCGYNVVVFCLYCAYCIELVQSRDRDAVILQLFSVYVVHTELNWCKQRLKYGYTAAVFCLNCAYFIELVQSRDWDMVIRQLPSALVVHNVLNWCKAETEMWLYCSCLLFILSILYWTGAKRRLRCGYTAAAFCLY